MQRMERRVNELDTDLKRTRQEATGLLGMLASSVSQVTGGGGGTGSTSSSAASSAAPADAGSGKQKRAAAAPAAPAAGAGSGSVGGFFSRMFGGKPSAAAAAAAPPPQQPQQPVPPAAPSGSGKQQKPAAAAAAVQAQARQAPASFPVADVEAAAAVAGEAAEGTASVQAITDGASSLIANSLKFTGMAAKVGAALGCSLQPSALCARLAARSHLLAAAWQSHRGAAVSRCLLAVGGGRRFLGVSRKLITFARSGVRGDASRWRLAWRRR